MWEEFGISGKIDFIKNNLQQSKKIWIFADTVHLFKNIRNCLYNKKHLSIIMKEYNLYLYKSIYHYCYLLNPVFLKYVLKYQKNI